MGEMQADLYVKDMENMAKRMTYCQRSRGGHVNIKKKTIRNIPNTDCIYS